MKYIFDFDDVLFNNTPEFKDRMFSVIAENGIPRDVAQARYKEVRGKEEFSLKYFLKDLFGNDNLYEKIMEKCPDFLNEEMIRLARKAGRENCYLVSNGEKEFQEDKIKGSGIASLFKEIYIVPDSKREAIEKICAENPDEDITFMDDKKRFFTDLDMKKCQNLKTILYKRN